MKINYLTWLHEKTGCHSEEIILPKDIENVDDLSLFLEKKHQKYQALFKNKNIIYVAINGETKTFIDPITNDDELSFFSAIVGG